jgi:2-polyprenyl-3-methyl-5-hydroxy-6-metoxy-1,4-benzoquinol methylase
MSSDAVNRRKGDAIAIEGGYQDNATFHASAPQRFWHQTRFAHSLELLAPERGDCVLDVGCGSGVFSNLIARNIGVEVTGVDANKAAIAFCRKKYLNPNLNFVQCSIDEIAFGKLSFDKISFLEVIEHIYRRQAEETLDLFHELLKPGGRLVLSTPNAHSMWPVIEKTMDFLQLVPQMQNEQHVTGYTPSSLKRLCEKHGFKQLESRAVFLLSPWIAAVNWRFAKAMERLERRCPIPIGCLLIASFERKVD